MYNTGLNTQFTGGNYATNGFQQTVNHDYNMYATAPAPNPSDPLEAYGSPLRIAREKHEFVMNSNASALDKVVASGDYYLRLAAVGLEKTWDLIKIGAEVAKPHVKEAFDKIPKPSEEQVVETMDKIKIPKKFQTVLLCQEATDFHAQEANNEIVEPKKLSGDNENDEEEVERYMREKRQRQDEGSRRMHMVNNDDVDAMNTQVLRGGLADPVLGGAAYESFAQEPKKQQRAPVSQQPHFGTDYPEEEAYYHNHHHQQQQLQHQPVMLNTQFEVPQQHDTMQMRRSGANLKMKDELDM